MFVSKKKYEEQYAIWQGAWYDKHLALSNALNEIIVLKNELDALKASRARSNENLKLGTAASAKARRKKVEAHSPLDWSKPIEAYHPDGRVLPAVYECDCGEHKWIYGSGGGHATVYLEDGSAWDVSSQDARWRIRNV